MLKPVVGRIVHYNPTDVESSGDKGQPYAAIITHVWNDVTVNVVVVNDVSFPMRQGAYGAIDPFTKVTLGDGPGQWSWPPICECSCAVKETT